MNLKLNWALSGLAGVFALVMISGCGEPAGPTNPTVVKKEVKIDDNGDKKVKIETETKNSDGTTTKTKEETKTETK